MISASLHFPTLPEKKQNKIPKQKSPFYQFLPIFFHRLKTRYKNKSLIYRTWSWCQLFTTHWSIFAIFSRSRADVEFCGYCDFFSWGIVVIKKCLDSGLAWSPRLGPFSIMYKLSTNRQINTNTAVTWSLLRVIVGFCDWSKQI